MRTRARVAALAAALLALAPGVAQACAVCFDARDANRAAFFATTVFMSLLPLGMVTGLVAWLRRRSRMLERGQGTGDGG